MTREKHPLTYFCGGCLGIYLLLVSPWPGVRGAYSAAFRSVLNAALYHERIPAEIRFEPQPPGDTFDTSIVIANRSQELLARQPVRTALFDTWDICYLPTALLVSVLLAAPTRLLAKMKSLLLGVGLMHLWLTAVVIGTIIHEINQAPELQLPLLPGWVEWILDRFFSLFVVLTVPSLIPPLAIAALVGFHRADWTGAVATNEGHKPGSRMGPATE